MHVPTPHTPLPRRPFDRSSFVLSATLAFLAVLTIYGFTTFDTNGVDMEMALDMLGDNAKTLFFAPGLSNVTIEGLLKNLGVTVALGFLTTVLGAVIGMVFALASALNLAPVWLSVVVKAVTAVVRAIPTVLWVLIFAVSAGLGSVAAVLGMTFHSAGYLIKAYAESFEEVDAGSIEALKASGADWWQVVGQVFIPSSRAALMSWTFLRFEINFSTAIAMGAAAGAGGIGFDMFMASGFYLNLREMGAFTYAILIFAVLLEYAATKLHAKTMQG